MARVEPYFVRDDLVGIRVVTGSVEEGVIQPYESDPGDRVDTKWGTIRRDGKEYGTLIERPEANDHVTLFDRFTPDPSEPFMTGGSADLAVSYTVLINGVESQIDAVWRKTKIIDTAQTGRWTRDFVTQHDLVLELGRDVRVGDDVDIAFGDPHLSPISFTFDDRQMFSEAIHVAQTGFEPADPVKVGYLSTWLGDRGEAPGSDGAVEYEVGRPFTVRDAATDQVVFEGKIELDKPLSEPSNHVINFNKTDVFKLDFSALETDGEYYLQVDGIGRSFTFEIAEDAWIEPFQTAMLGFYHQRSGLELEAQFTEWTRPRDLHPEDGVIIRQSSATLMDTSMGLNLQGENSFEALVAGATDEVVPDAWGGWHDAGDWDRRAQHLKVSRDFLELAEARPQFARSVELSLPEADNGIPDLIDEALWNLDFFMRLQKPDGGVPGGVESASHPKYGEPSWFESQDVFVYAPDAWASFEYAATAARAARVVTEYDQVRAAGYEDSAVAAMNWAEANLPGYAEGNADVNNARNLAAVELYKLTGNEAWHDLFLATTSYDGGQIAWNEHQFDAVMVYDAAAREGLAAEDVVLSLGRQDLVNFADFLITTGDRGAFGQIINPNTPIGFGYTSTVPADAANVLVKAHILTGDEDYFAAILSDTQFGLGANPDNLVFTTGLGDRAVTEALVVDGLILGEMPAGITLFGMWNVGDRGRHGTFTEIDAHTFPVMSQSSPVHETFNADIRAVPLTEYSIHSTMGPTAYVWGYLAATDASGTDEAPHTPPLEPEPEPQPQPEPEPILLRGDDGANRLEGTSGADRIEGLGGNDNLFGMGGADVLTGGAGWDSFWGTIGDLDGDRITDFNSERVIVENAKFGNADLRVARVEDGLAVGVDTNGDGVVDGTILFEELFQGGFRVQARNDAHTEIRFAATGGVEPGSEPEPQLGPASVQENLTLSPGPSAQLSVTLIEQGLLSGEAIN